MVKFRTMALLVMLSLTAASADDESERKYIMNFDLIINKPADGDVYYSIQQQGIQFSNGKPFHGNDLGEFDYFITVSRLDDDKAKLTIEFYQFATRRKESDVISEVVADVDFNLGSPATFEGWNDKFGVDLAFSVVEK